MNEKNPRNLFSLVALIYFPFLISVLTKDSDDYELSENDIKIINTYKKAWWFMIFMTFTIVILFLISFRYSSFLYFDSVAYFWTILLVIYLFYNIYLIFTDKSALLFSWKDVTEIKVQKVESWNLDYLFLYIPFLNSYKYILKDYTENQIYWLKESNLLYLILSVFWILSIYFSIFLSLFYILLLFIIIRVISLLFWIDFIPDNLKEIIYNSYKNNIWTIFSYISWPIKYLFVNFYQFLKKKSKVPFDVIIKNTKVFLETEYDLKTILKKPKKYLFLILSYLIFIIYFSYLFYTNLNSFNIYVIYISLFILISYFILKIYFTKKIPVIPFLTCVMFYLVKLFK